ncbi:MAG TPA: hydrogenase maturation protease [Candidatus Binataceae bacterium]|nr:hydrogenase maturation protease [Candidatus Binataceae bacterium]
MAACVVGIGQEWAGDDGVGIAVIRRLRQDGAALDLVEASEPTQLISLLTGGADPVVVVDAILDDDGPPGRVLLVEMNRAGGFCERLLSTHGVGVMEAIELARIAHPGGIAKSILVVGVTIGRPSRSGGGLSPEVEAAAPRAAAQAIKLACGDTA